MTNARLRQWLAFSNGDQKVLREDTRGSLWHGLVVPGTLATYYKQGVGGYVLARRKPFVIDPRTPLLQDGQISPRPTPKASHETLACIHHPDLLPEWSAGLDPPLEFWTPQRWELTVGNVLAFQTDFERTASTKVEKYELMLRKGGSSLDLDRPIMGPERLIPPYFAVLGRRDGWWSLTRQAIEAALQRHPAERIMPVICLRRDAPTDVFAELIADLPAGIRYVFCWRGSWEEDSATAEDVRGWLRAVDTASGRDVEVVNMYGGALSVFLTGRGLAGVNHGVGYSESRDERRLSQTGGAAMRYYIPKLHHFFAVPTAQTILDSLGPEWECRCRVCREHPESILDMKPEELKLHFLIARALEYRRADDVTGTISELRTAAAELADRFGGSSEAPGPLLAERGRILTRWASLLEAGPGFAAAL